MPPAPVPSASNSDALDQFRLLVHSVVDYGMFILDPGGHVASWNSGAQLIKQYSAEEIIGQHFSVFYPPDALAADWPNEELRRAERLGRFEDEGWRVRKDGSRFWANVVITALRAPDGSLQGYAKVTRDLSERRQHEEALRISEQRFRLLVEGVKDSAIFMLNPQGLVESWNSGAELIKGYAAAEVMGRHFSIFYTADEVAADRPAAELDSARQQGRVESEGWRVRKDGSAFWAQTVISTMLGSAQELLGFALLTRDLTQNRRVEELEKSSRRMSEFLAMLAHELRNPLAPIRNAVSVMQLDPVASPVIRKSRDVIDRQLTHMTRLVDDLLDAGRLTTGKIALQRERLRYDQVVARAVEVVQPQMDAHGHQLVVDLPPHELFVMGDAVRLSQVLQNLLLNAAKFTPERGRIGVEVRMRGTQVHTAVRDNGVGLTGREIEEIFRLFAQGDTRQGDKEGGLGIGLTLARSLVEMHGGVLQAHSEGPGQGSRFEFFLPDAELGPRLHADTDGVVCLVVDDNRDAAGQHGRDPAAPGLQRLRGLRRCTGAAGDGGACAAGGVPRPVDARHGRVRGAAAHARNGRAAALCGRGRVGARHRGGPAPIPGGGIQYPHHEAGGPGRVAPVPGVGPGPAADGITATAPRAGPPVSYTVAPRRAAHCSFAIVLLWSHQSRGNQACRLLLPRTVSAPASAPGRVSWRAWSSRFWCCGLSSTGTGSAGRWRSTSRSAPSANSAWGICM